MPTRYLETRQTKQGIVYWWVPPREVRAAGIFNMEKLGHDRTSAEEKANELNSVYDRWAANKGKANYDGSVASLFAKFQHSIPWLHKISDATRERYRWAFTYAGRIEFDSGIMFADMAARQVNRKTVTALYAALIEKHGISLANLCYAACRRAWNVCMTDYDLVEVNPFLGRQLETTEPEKVIWTREQFHTMCETAERLEHPEVSLACKLAYWLGQRPVDILALKWEDYEDGKILIRQQKTKKVRKPFLLPVPDILREDLDKAERRGATIIAKEAGYPYDRQEFAALFCFIRRKAKLPDELKFSKFRATAATEIANSGGTEDEIMAVGGWLSRQVVSEYVQRTNRQAENAMQKRVKNYG